MHLITQIFCSSVGFSVVIIAVSVHMQELECRVMAFHEHTDEQTRENRRDTNSALTAASNSHTVQAGKALFQSDSVTFELEWTQTC